MSDYKTMYFKLAAKVADAIDILTEVQQLCEEMYIENDNPPATPVWDGVPDAPKPTQKFPLAKGGCRPQKAGGFPARQKCFLGFYYII